MQGHGYATASEVKQAAAGRWLEVFKRVSPSLAPAVDALVATRGRRHVPCPVHGGRDGFRLYLDANDTGVGICNTCGTRQGVDLIAWAEGCDYLVAKDWVAEQVGLLPGQHAPLLPATPRLVVPERPTLTLEEANRRRRTLLRIVRESLHVSDVRAKPLHQYLAGRRLSPRSLNQKAFRFHPGLMLFGAEGEKLGRFPALLSFLVNADGVSVTVHRTYLTPEGEKVDRKVMVYDELAYDLTGCAVRLSRPGTVLSVGEGIETMLSVLMATRMPCWAAGNTSLLAALDIPEGVKEIWIWADKDRSGAGEEAAVALAERACAEGIAARILLPHGDIPSGNKSLDWNDIWRNQGQSGFPRVDACVKLARAA